MAKTLLLISEKPEDSRFGAQVAETAGLVLRNTRTAADGVAVIDAEDGCVVMVDADTPELYAEFEKQVQDRIGLFSAKLNANHLHYLSSKDIYEVPYLIQSPLFGCYIRRNFEQDVNVGQHYGRLVKASVAGHAFGLQALLKPGTKVQTIKLQQTTQKQEAVEAIRAYLIALKFQSRMATVMANAVDELLMNAMFDAPVDGMGRHVLDSTSRATKLVLEGRHSVELCVAFDGEYVALMATDLFGSLDKSKLLSAISKIYTAEEYKVRTSVAGAGLGLASVFHSGGSFFFTSEQGVRTEVTVFFRRTDSFRQFKEQFRFLSTQFYF